MTNNKHDSGRTRVQASAPDQQQVLWVRGLNDEIANILTPIVAFKEMIEEDSHLDQQVRSDLDFIGKAAERGKDFISKLLATAALIDVDSIEMELLDLAEVLEEGWGDSSVKTRALLALGESEKHSFEQADWKVTGDPRLLRKVMNELKKNSQANEASMALIKVGVDKNHVVVRVNDNGKGVSQNDLKMLADPYHSSSFSHSKGMGLALVNGIINAHGGKVFFESDPARPGLTVELRWPIAS